MKTEFIDSFGEALRNCPDELWEKQLWEDEPDGAQPDPTAATASPARGCPACGQPLRRVETPPRCRVIRPPWGAGGGQDGSPNAVEVVPAGAAEPDLRRGKLARQRLRRGDVVRLITGMGGGYGDPQERAAEAIREDVRNGHLTWEEAGRVYGAAPRFSLDV